MMLIADLPHNNLERLILMNVYFVRIHFINGEVLPIAECREDDGECQIVERYRNAPPDRMLCIGNKECGELFIPVSNILYIGVESEDED